MKPFVQSLHNVKAYIPPNNFYQAELPTMPPPRGRVWCDGGLCPFHPDKHSGSFWVNLENGAFTCFSCGTKGGDIIAFTQQRDGLSFPEAVQKLTDDWGL